MGTIRNEMVIVHSYLQKDAKKLRTDAIETFMNLVKENKETFLFNDFTYDMVSPIMESYINQEYTFVINGECSKIGWEESELFHKVRMNWCEKHKEDANIVVINFGEGDESCRIVFDNTGYQE